MTKDDQIKELKTLVWELSPEVQALLDRDDAATQLCVEFHDGKWKAWDAEYSEEGHVVVRPRRSP